MFRAAVCLVCCCFSINSAPAVFEAASIRPSRSIVGHDGEIAIGPARFTARNATLKRLIFEAYQVPYSQIAGGPRWIDSDEYDVEATSGAPVTAEQLRVMLQALLADRFRLMAHTETRELKAYTLVAAKGEPKLRTVPDKARPASWKFHGTLSEFADRLSLELSIPFLSDPAIPSRPAGPPVPVVNRTGIEGVYEMDVDTKPEPGTDPFTFWQRVLQDQFGLKLESHPAPVAMLVIDQADKIAIDGN